MPELPEVEVLVRKLRPQILNKTVSGVRVERRRTTAPTSPSELLRTLHGATFVNVSRRGKYLLFDLRPKTGPNIIRLVGHLGMTGRMYLLPSASPLPTHSAAVLELGGERLIFEDTRYFGRMTLDATALERIGSEPLEAKEPPAEFIQGLKRSKQAIKVKLLDQSLVAGLGNIYASEALFVAGISPRASARRLDRAQIVRLWGSIREVLTRAIETGASIRLPYPPKGGGEEVRDPDGVSAASPSVTERFYVYGRNQEPCLNCGKRLKRIVQAARSTFYCPGCQRSFIPLRRSRR